MGIFSWIGRLFYNSAPISSPKTRDEMLELLGGISESSAGVSVTPETAIRHSTVYSCVKIISETVAQLPCVLYEREAGDDNVRVRAKNHNLYSILRNSPNDFQRSEEHTSELQSHHEI